jgi:hypothetical protein
VAPTLQPFRLRVGTSCARCGSKLENRSSAAGADILLQQLTFGHKFQPVNLQVAFYHEHPVLVEDPTEEGREEDEQDHTDQM